MAREDLAQHRGTRAARAADQAQVRPDEAGAEEAVLLVNTFARWRRADGYPIGMPEATRERLVERYGLVWVWVLMRLSGLSKALKELERHPG